MATHDWHLRADQLGDVHLGRDVAILTPGSRPPHRIAGPLRAIAPSTVAGYINLKIGGLYYDLPADREIAVDMGHTS